MPEDFVSLQKAIEHVAVEFGLSYDEAEKIVLTHRKTPDLPTKESKS